MSLEQQKIISGVEDRLRCIESTHQSFEHSLLVYLKGSSVGFAKDKVQGIRGFMVSAQGLYRIVADRRLSEVQDLELCLHSLGHIAAGHIPSPQDNVHYEFRQADYKRFHSRVDVYKEKLADDWVRKVLDEVNSNSSNPWMRSLSKVQRNLSKIRY